MSVFMIIGNLKAEVDPYSTNNTLDIMQGGVCVCLYVCMLLYSSVLLSRENREELKKTFLFMSQHGVYLPNPHCELEMSVGFR